MVAYTWPHATIKIKVEENKKCSSSIALAIFHLLGSHKGLMATLLDSTTIEYLHLLDTKLLTLQVMFTNFCCVNTPTTISVRLPTWYHWTWNWKEIHAVNSWEPIGIGSRAPLVLWEELFLDDRKYKFCSLYSNFILCDWFSKNTVLTAC